MLTGLEGAIIYSGPGEGGLEVDSTQACGQAGAGASPVASPVTSHQPPSSLYRFPTTLLICSVNSPGFKRPRTGGPHSAIPHSPWRMCPAQEGWRDGALFMCSAVQWAWASGPHDTPRAHVCACESPSGLGLAVSSRCLVGVSRAELSWGQRGRGGEGRGRPGWRGEGWAPHPHRDPRVFGT